jgi:HAD superfamily hydrolase (TIGR01484 family)
MKNTKHLFFDMDMTIAPARQPITPEMFELLHSLEQDIVIVSGSMIKNIAWQSKDLPAIYLGNNGNHAIEVDGSLIWQNPDLTDVEQAEIMEYIATITAALPHTPNAEWNPVENRGSQITFSPIGNTAPVDIKMAYDPDRKKREALMEEFPFESETVMLKIGGSTSLDFFSKNGHKGVNVARLIELKGWNKEDCIYYGDGLYPGGNDELVIGVIDTVPVDSDKDTFEKLSAIYT